MTTATLFADTTSQPFAPALIRCLENVKTPGELAPLVNRACIIYATPYNVHLYFDDHASDTRVIVDFTYAHGSFQVDLLSGYERDENGKPCWTQTLNGLRVELDSKRGLKTLQNALNAIKPPYCHSFTAYRNTAKPSGWDIY